MATKVATVNTQKNRDNALPKLYAAKMSLGDRIETILSERGWSQAELARRINVKSTTIWKLVSGQSQTSKHLREIAKALGTSEGYLLGETDDPSQRLSEQRTAYHAKPDDGQPDNSVMIPQLKMGYSMGGGSVFADYQQTDMVPFPREWLRPMIHGSFADLFVARGEGDSMMPTLLDGDLCIVDTAQQTVTQQDRLWCLSYGDLGMIKRVRQMPDGGAQVISDNPAVVPFTAYDNELHVIGRVIWIGRRV